jgi:hypothetical protein
MSARRKWALENAACALVVFGSMAAVLLFDSSVRAESTTGSAVRKVRPWLLQRSGAHDLRCSDHVADFPSLITHGTDAVIPG